MTVPNDHEPFVDGDDAAPAGIARPDASDLDRTDVDVSDVNVSDRDVHDRERGADEPSPDAEATDSSTIENRAAATAAAVAAADARINTDDYWYDNTEALDREYRGSVDDANGRKPFRFTIKLLFFVAVIYFFVIPLIPNFRDAWRELGQVEPTMLLLGLLLENVALWCYAPLMQTALGDAGKKIGRGRLYRIQMSTRALSSIVPGGSAASSALGYRLMRLSGVAGPDAGFALATVGIGSALVLNLILWVGLVLSIPIRGVNPIYGTAAMVGVILMGTAAAVVYGLMEGQGHSEQVIRWIAGKLHLNQDKAALVLHRVAERLEQLISDRQLLGRVVFWAALNWILDCASLWVFLRAFGISMGLDAIIIAFGVANLIAAIPITPGGLGPVDATMITLLIGFGATVRGATLGVPAYRFSQLFFPIIVGGLMYLSLRVGPWSIERRDRLIKLRQLADQASRRGSESRIDFQLRFPTRDGTGHIIRREPSSPRHRPVDSETGTEAESQVGQHDTSTGTDTDPPA